jgi:hypothetical protein
MPSKRTPAKGKAKVKITASGESVVWASGAGQRRWAACTPWNLQRRQLLRTQRWTNARVTPKQPKTRTARYALAASAGSAAVRKARNKA